jgi:hypothetical protein
MPVGTYSSIISTSQGYFDGGINLFGLIHHA